MEHPDIAMLVATGGASVVRAALSSGKKAIAAGPGNPPAIIDETADLQQAARHVIAGTSFDNNLLCIGEKALFVVDSVANETIQELTRNGGHLLGESQREALEAVVTENGEANKEYIGKDTTTILNAAGITAPTGTVAIVVEVPGGPRICYQRVSDADSARRPLSLFRRGIGRRSQSRRGTRAHRSTPYEQYETHHTVHESNGLQCCGYQRSVLRILWTGRRGLLSNDYRGTNRRRVHPPTHLYSPETLNDRKQFISTYVVTQVIDPALKDEASAKSMQKHLWNSEADWRLQRSSRVSC